MECSSLRALQLELEFGMEDQWITVYCEFWSCAITALTFTRVSLALGHNRGYRLCTSAAKCPQHYI